MYVLEAVWAEYIQYMTFACLTQRSQSGTDNHNRRVHVSLLRTLVAPFHLFHMRSEW
jgi:hypothetical protein